MQLNAIEQMTDIDHAVAAIFDGLAPHNGVHFIAAFEQKLGEV